MRKLEFLLAEVLRQGHDCVLTLGGIQSNHCRATAVAARYLGLACHLVLRTSRPLVDQDPGLTGNLLLERLVGAHVHLVCCSQGVFEWTPCNCAFLDMFVQRSAGPRPSSYESC